MGVFGVATSWAQVSDHFNDGNDDGWARLDPLLAVGGTAAFSFPDGNSYRVQAGVSPDAGSFGQARVGSLLEEINHTAFRVVVDVVATDAGLEQDVGILTRVSTPGLGTLNGYSASFDTDERQVYLSRVDGEQPTALESVEVPLDPAKSYRIIFHGFEDQFLIEVFDVADLTTTIGTVVAFDDVYTDGMVGIFGSAGQANGAVDVTFDNFETGGNPDTDQDGMSDPAEAAVFGNLDQTGEADFDGDGRSNAEELELGSNPTVPDAVIEVSGLSLEEDVLRLSFLLLEGKSFQFEKSVDLKTWEVDDEAVFTDLGDGKGEFEAARSGGRQFVRVKMID